MTNLSVKCPSCMKDYNPQGNIRKLPISETKTYESGIECPFCQYWTSAYFTTDELEQKRANLQSVSRNPAIKPQERERMANKLRQQIQREHDILQSRLRKLKS